MHTIPWPSLHWRGPTCCARMPCVSTWKPAASTHAPRRWPSASTGRPACWPSTSRLRCRPARSSGGSSTRSPGPAPPPSLTEAHRRRSLVLVENHIDARTPMGKLFFRLLAAFAEWEADLIKERTMSGKLEKQEQPHTAGKTASAGDRSTPYGLRYSAPAHKGQDGEWRRVPEQARWVRFMFEQTAQGKGGDTVATMLNER